MSLPEGVTAATLTVKAAKTTPPSPISVSVTIAPSQDLTHAESGDKLSDMIEPLVSAWGQVPTIVVPHSSQAGFVDDSGTEVSRWYYIATITGTTANGSLAYAPATKAFQLPDESTADLESLPTHTPSPADVPTPSAPEESPASPVGPRGLSYRGIWFEYPGFANAPGFVLDTEESVIPPEWILAGDALPTMTVFDEDLAEYALTFTGIEVDETSSATFTVSGIPCVRVGYNTSIDDNDALEIIVDGLTVWSAAGDSDGFHMRVQPLDDLGEHTVTLQYTRNTPAGTPVDPANTVWISGVGVMTGTSAPYLLGEVVDWDDRYFLTAEGLGGIEPGTPADQDAAAWMPWLYDF